MTINEALAFHERQVQKCRSNEMGAIARGDNYQVIANIRKKMEYYLAAVEALKIVSSMCGDSDKKLVDT